MTTNSYKTESYHFMVFRSLVKDFTAEEVWHEDSPDFIIHTENGKLGIEHCLVHIPTHQRTPLQAIESQTDEIISIAQEHAELRGMPPIQANFLFGHVPNMVKSERIILAREIARVIYDKLIQANIRSPMTQIVIRQPELPKQLSSIYITTLKNESRHFWRCNRAGWAIENCTDLFEETILKKEKHYNDYIKKCNECWLLMVAEAKPSGFIHPNPKTIKHKFRSSFDKIYFMDLSERNIHLLNTIAI